jgi:thioredoxin 1
LTTVAFGSGFLSNPDMPLHQNTIKTLEKQSPKEFLVICLCAEWCGTCRDYRAGFVDLAALFPDVRFLWLDIEDQADDLGDLDIDNFPTLLIRRHESVLFFGTMLPHLSNLHRLIEAFRDQTPEQSRAYALANPQRRSWQENPDLCRLGGQAVP